MTSSIARISSAALESKVSTSFDASSSLETNEGGGASLYVMMTKRKAASRYLRALEGAQPQPIFHSYISESVFLGYEAQVDVSGNNQQNQSKELTPTVEVSTGNRVVQHWLVAYASNR
jgi:hypothetical protein